MSAFKMALIILNIYLLHQSKTQIYLKINTIKVDIRKKLSKNITKLQKNNQINLKMVINKFNIKILKEMFPRPLKPPPLLIYSAPEAINWKRGANFNFVDAFSDYKSDYKSHFYKKKPVYGFCMKVTMYKYNAMHVKKK